MVRWEKDPYNDNRYSFMYLDHLIDHTDDNDMYKGLVNIDDVKYSIDNLWYFLSLLDVIYGYDSGEGEPTVWLKR
jgi:hypothetical protein